jgi:ATP-dependent RNA helicase DHR2
MSEKQSKKRKRDGLTGVASPLKVVDVDKAPKSIYKNLNTLGSPKKGVPSANGRPITNGKNTAPRIFDGATEESPRKDKYSKKTQSKSMVLLAGRKKLPIWTHQDDIRKQLAQSNVLVLVGETGSGKSTQVPQFVIDEPWCQRREIEQSKKEKKRGAKKISVGGCIAITQPRRVAAITLARRVAAEMGTPLGKDQHSQVGYSVRFDNSTSASTRIKFLTEGMLLQEMLRDPSLREYSAVIVDEVHERSVNVDLILGFLRNIVGGEQKERHGRKLKVVVMSATAEMERIQNFFQDGFDSTTPLAMEDVGSDAAIKSVTMGGEVIKSGKSNDTSKSGSSSESSEPEKSPDLGNTKRFVKGVKHEASDADSETSWSGISSSEAEEEIKPIQASNETIGKIRGRSESRDSTKEVLKVEPPPAFNGASTITTERKMVAMCHIEGRQHPVEILYMSEPVQDFVDAALKTVFQIHYHEALPGDILVFLTGQDDIEALEKLILEYAAGMGPEMPKVYP